MRLFNIFFKKSFYFYSSWNNVNIFMIQQQLREGVFISIPRIQQTYGLTYSQGKRFLQNLMDRGWVDEKPIGIRYRICKGMLKLRKIQKDEVVDLVDAITSDAATALMVIVQGNGVDFDDVEEKCVVAPENRNFTKEKIAELTHFQEQFFRTEIRMQEKTL